MEDRVRNIQPPVSPGGPRKPRGPPTALPWHRGRAGRTGQPRAGSWVFTLQTEAEGRLGCGREVQTPRCQAACLPWSQGLSVPPAAPRAACTTCGWRATLYLHAVGEAARVCCPSPHPAPPQPHQAPLPVPGVASCLQHQPSDPLSTPCPGKLHSLPHLFNRQSSCQALCLSWAPAQGETGAG